MKVLHLTLKKKWFDMIASGEKKEEYREIKPYWVSRLVEALDTPTRFEIDEGFTFEYPNGSGLIHSMLLPKHFDAVLFKNGYCKNAPSVLLKISDIVTGYGKEEWGAEFGKPYFVIKLGEIIH